MSFLSEPNFFSESLNKLQYLALLRKENFIKEKNVFFSALNCVMFLGAIASVMCLVIFNKQRFGAGKVFGILLGFLIASLLIEVIAQSVAQSFFAKRKFKDDDEEMNFLSTKCVLFYKATFYSSLVKCIICFVAITVLFVLHGHDLIDVDVRNSIAIAIGVIGIIGIFISVCVLPFYKKLESLDAEFNPVIEIDYTVDRDGYDDDFRQSSVHPKDLGDDFQQSSGSPKDFHGVAYADSLVFSNKLQHYH